MVQVEFAIPNDVGPGCAKISSRARIFSVAAEELYLGTDWKILILLHRLGRLSVDHHAAVANRPTRSPLILLAHDAVFDT